MADSTAEEARKARARARAQNSWRGSTGSTDRLVMDLTRGKAGLLDKIGGRYVNQEEQRAANIMQKRREMILQKLQDVLLLLKSVRLKRQQQIH
jgi:hypothetical protein